MAGNYDWSRARRPAGVIFPQHECETPDPDIERIRPRRQLRVVREVGLEEGLEVENANIRSGWVRRMRDLCQGAQGGRGRGANTTTFQQNGDEQADKGVWMSVRMDDGVDENDEVHKQCVAAGLEVTFPPTDMPWSVREMHLRHPDGHVFRVSRGNEGEE